MARGLRPRREPHAQAEKYLEAAQADWRVLLLTELQITAPMIERIILGAGPLASAVKNKRPGHVSPTRIDLGGTASLSSHAAEMFTE